MRMRLAVPIFLLSTILAAPLGSAQNQQPSNESSRRIVRKTVAAYPELARKLNISGAVKVMATVSPDGTVKAVQPVGGSPILLQSAQDAVLKWKFATASAESREVIELKFDAQY